MLQLFFLCDNLQQLHYQSRLLYIVWSSAILFFLVKIASKVAMTVLPVPFFMHSLALLSSVYIVLGWLLIVFVVRKAKLFRYFFF